MKTIFFILMLTSTSLIAGEKTDPNLNSLLGYIGVTDFIASVKKIKSYKSVEEIEELDYQLKKYYSNVHLWQRFDEVQYENGLRSKLKKAFKPQEMIQLDNIFMKPFLGKVIKAMVINRNYFLFSQNLLDSKFNVPELVQSRYMLMKNLYLLHGMDIQNEKVKEILQSYAETKIKYVTLVHKINGEKIFTNPIELKKRVETSQDFLIRYLGKDLTSFRHYEFREYLRVMKGATIQRFIQLYSNYHFLYHMKFMDSYKFPKELIKNQGLNTPI